MKHILAVILSVLAAAALSAQSPAELKSQLASADSPGGSRIIITESPDISQQINRAHYDPGKKIRGYRVRIFFDNSQQAGAEAYGVMAQFKAAFPDIPVYRVYENPYFKVAVGDCLTRDEAVMIWGRVKYNFGSAYIFSEDIPLSQFVIEE